MQRLGQVIPVPRLGQIRQIPEGSREVPESFGADAEISFWFLWHCLSHCAFYYVNHVMIWIWLSNSEILEPTIYAPWLGSSFCRTENM